MNRCERIEALISRQRDEQLSFYDRIRIWWHSARCPHCRQAARQFDWLERAAPRAVFGGEPLTDEAQRSIEARVLRALDADEGTP